MLNKYKYCIIKRKKTNSRPIKKLLTHVSDLDSYPQIHSVLGHRKRILQELEFDSEIDVTDWSGTALDFLLDGKKISKKMHFTALSYAWFSRRNIYQAPNITQQMWGKKFRNFKKIDASYILYSSSSSFSFNEFEVIWRQINRDLAHSGVKYWIDKITLENDYQSLKSVLKEQSLLNRIRDSLEKIEGPVRHLRKISKDN